ASTVTLPAPVSVTVFPETVPGPERMAKWTGRPELAVALSVNGASPNVRSGSGAKAIVCATGKAQWALPPESCESVADTTTGSVLTLSRTFTKDKARLPCGSMSHGVPGADDCSASRLPAAPCSVSAPVTVCVVPAWKVTVSAAATILLRLKNVVDPPTCRPVPVSATVPPLATKTPPVTDQSPVSLRVDVGAVSWPAVTRTPAALTGPAAPVKLPPSRVRPPSKAIG